MFLTCEFTCTCYTCARCVARSRFTSPDVLSALTDVHCRLSLVPRFARVSHLAPCCDGTEAEDAEEAEEARGSVKTAGQRPSNETHRPTVLFGPERRRHSANLRVVARRGASLPRMPGRTHGHPPDSAMIGPRALPPHPAARCRPRGMLPLRAVSP